MVTYVESEKNVADIMTKPLPGMGSLRTSVLNTQQEFASQAS